MAAEDYIEFDDYWEDSRYDPTESRRTPKTPQWPGLNRDKPKGTVRPGYLGPNHGMSWDRDQEEKLLRDFKKHYPLSDLAARMGRTEVAIVARLEKLGIDFYTRQPAKSCTPTVSNPQPVKEASMNKMHLLALLQTGYTTVHVCFDEKCKGQTYIYKVPTKMAVVAGDMLVVPARDTFNLAWVKSVDKAPKIDVKAPFEYKWVVQKVDKAGYTDQTEREAQALDQLEDAQRAEAQRKAMELLLGPGANSEAFLALINAEAAQ